MIMANEKALRLIELGLHPVLLGSAGDDLKRPLRKGWRTAVSIHHKLCGAGNGCVSPPHKTKTAVM